MWDYICRIHDHHCKLTVETRILKLTEEVGEAAEAYIGMHGLNSRKGICKTRDDLLAELADVIITAAVAMVGVTDGDTKEASEHLQRRLHTVTTRVGI
jgi:NTP pyrophosphatase (non-canonical NTP hydrolase)